MKLDPIYGFTHSDAFVSAIRLAYEEGLEEFFEKLKVAEAAKIASACNDEERFRVQIRVLMIGELSNFTKSLLTLDKDT